MREASSSKYIYIVHTKCITETAIYIHKLLNYLIV